MDSITTPQVKYLAITDFRVISKALELGLTPIECRTWHYINSCNAHGIKFDIFEATEYLEIEIGEFLAIAATLEYLDLLENLENQTTGGIENA